MRHPITPHHLALPVGRHGKVGGHGGGPAFNKAGRGERGSLRASKRAVAVRSLAGVVGSERARELISGLGRGR